MSSSWTTTTKRIAERPSVDVLVNNLGICEAVGFFGLTSGIAT